MKTAVLPNINDLLSAFKAKQLENDSLPTLEHFLHFNHHNIIYANWCYETNKNTIQHLISILYLHFLLRYMLFRICAEITFLWKHDFDSLPKCTGTGFVYQAITMKMC